jgi:hypothetical protein
MAPRPGSCRPLSRKGAADADRVEMGALPLDRLDDGVAASIDPEGEAATGLGASLSGNMA